MTQLGFTTLFTSQLEKLNREQVINFGLNICERLLPDYISFSDKNNWGSPKLLKDAIQYCKDGTTNNKNNEELIKLINEVDRNIPDMDDFGNYDGSFALNSSASIYCLLKYLLDEDKNHIMDISTYMFDNIDFILSAKEPGLTNEELDNHMEVIKERLFQVQLLNDVA